MSRPLILAAALAAILSVPANAAAVGKGRLGTLPLGRYLCETPGDATGLASRPVEAMWFDVVTGSSYDGPGGRGTYLLTGDTVIFTRGPMRGLQFVRVSQRTLKGIDVASMKAGVRCVRTGRRFTD